ncbi:MAG TPA: hypothetical protein VI039_07410 [Solirubrobacterales bacterium]
MPHPRLRRAALLLSLAVATALAGTASGALVEVDNVVLRADGGFQPQSLPARQFAPIDFQGYLDIEAKEGPLPSPLRQALIDFDRDGRLSVGGLPSCAPGSLTETGAQAARRICRRAMVGSGHIEVLIPTLDQGTGAVEARAPLTIFNGPRAGGLPTAVLHARLSTVTYVITVPIEKRRGEFRYRARLDVPELIGNASISHVDVKIGRRYKAGGQSRSYVSARCSDNILETHGRFSFEDGTIVDGQVEKYCHAK